jgi:hypothetical protein
MSIKDKRKAVNENELIKTMKLNYIKKNSMLKSKNKKIII